MASASTQSDSFLSTSFFRSVVIFLFHLLVVTVPLFFAFNTSELFEFNKMVLTYALTIGIVGAWGARMALAKKWIIRTTFLDIPIIIFVLSQILATIFSIHPHTSLFGYYSRFHGGLFSVITYVALFYAFISNFEKKDLPPFFLSMFGSSLLVSFYAILEHFGHSVSCYIVSDGENFGVDCWKQDVQSRVFASFGQPNWLAAYLITLLPLSVVLALQKKASQLLKGFYIVTATTLFITLLFTQSRSGLLGLVVGLSVLAGLTIWHGLQHRKFTNFIQEQKKSLTILILGFIGSVLLFGTIYTPSLSAMLNTTEPTQAPVAEKQQPINRLEVGGTDSGEIRKIVWQGAIKVWQRYPFFGSGLETFAYSYYLDRPIQHNMVSEWDFLYNKAHNEFLNYLATTGLVGLVSYLFLLSAFFIGTIKMSRLLPSSEINTSLLLSASIAGVVALSVSNFFGFSTVMVTILMYLFFAMPVILCSDPVPELKEKEPSTLQYVWISVIGIVCLFLVGKVYQYWRADVLYTRAQSEFDAGFVDQGTATMRQAINNNPDQAEFYDELATQYSRYALSYAQQGEAEQAQALAIGAIEMSNAVMQLNPHQLNFYKTRAGVFITLAQMNPEFLNQAEETLLQGSLRAPTDAKLLFNLGVVNIAQEETAKGIDYLEKAVELKPNYESARSQLAQAYESNDQIEAALEQLIYINENIAPNKQEITDKIASLSAQKTQEE